MKAKKKDITRDKDSCDSEHQILRSTAVTTCAFPTGTSESTARSSSIWIITQSLPLNATMVDSEKTLKMKEFGYS